MLFVLFFLSAALLCGSVLAANLSEQLAVSQEAVQKEQSRLLARSGWNLALEQMQLYGTVDPVSLERSTGEIVISAEVYDVQTAMWNVTAQGRAGVYNRTASGVVQCFPFPFAHTTGWDVITDVQDQNGADILLVDDSMYQLCTDCAYPLGITSARQEPVTVEIADTRTVSELYIYGNLHVSGALTAEKIYVTGTISGAEQIQCDVQREGCIDEMLYQIRVQERTIT